MLLPALNKARSKAQAISCMGNLKQIAQGCALYSMSYADYTPTRYTTEVCWKDLIQGMLAKSRQADSSVQAWWKDPVFLCPTPNTVTPGSKAYTQTYGLSPSLHRPVKITRITNPSVRLYASELRNGGTTDAWSIGQPQTQWGIGDLECYISGSYYNYPDNYCHDKAVNVFYVDGHVEIRKRYLQQDLELFRLWNGFTMVRDSKPL